MTEVVPPYTDMLWVTLRVLASLGGSASISELDGAVIEAAGWTEPQQQVLHGDGPKTEIEYRLAWARTYLKGMGLLINSSRGVWSVTDVGRGASERELPGLHAAYTAAIRRRKNSQSAVNTSGVVVTADSAAGSQEDGDPTSDSDWRDGLLEALMALQPAAFERVAQRLLREAGFLSATVTGRSGDGGIDGLGVYQLSLLSFPVFFQCKRYRGSVGSGAVRDFRGAMAGRGDKGLLITTGTFTADARGEATRDGAPPIDLIDGDRLCNLLKEHGLGVRTTIRQVEDVSLDTSFFDSLSRT